MNLFKKCKYFAKFAIYTIIKPNLFNSFKIKSHLTFQERILLYKYSKNKKNIVEIGSYVGASACCFGEAIKSNNDSKIYCIDTWKNDAMTEGKKNTFKEFQFNTKKYSNKIIKIKGYSHEVFDKIDQRIESIDLLFIDGDHSYDGVKKDWDIYSKLLVKNSVVIFHDFGWAEGVKKVINENVLKLLSKKIEYPNIFIGIIK